MITATILTKNSGKHLEKVLESLESFEEILVGDTGSTDNTLEIAFKFKNVRVVLIPFEGFGKTHNKLTEHAKNEWIFSIDSDEIPEEGLIGEIQSLKLEDSNVYSIARKNFYRGVWVKSCGWYPDRVIRLYNRKMTHFSSHDVHEAVVTNELRVVELKKALRHYPYERVSDFLLKMQLYTDLFAKQNMGKRQSGYMKASLHAMYTFFKSYFLKRGFMQGGIGFEIAAYNSITAFYKYVKLREANLEKS